MALAFLLVGPAPFLSLEPSVPLMTGALALIGAGTVTIYIGTFGRALKRALERGYADDVATYQTIAGDDSTVTSI